MQQLQNALLRGIRLRQHRGGRLLQDLRLSQIGAFCRKVSVLNARTTGFKVGRDVRQVRDRAVQAVRYCAQACTLGAFSKNRLVGSTD
jgi:hypothetical protein